jgi:hypothetical protein
MVHVDTVQDHVVAHLDQMTAADIDSGDKSAPPE